LPNDEATPVPMEQLNDTRRTGAYVQLHPLLREFAVEQWEAASAAIQGKGMHGLVKGVAAYVEQHQGNFAALSTIEELIRSALLRATEQRIARQDVTRAINALFSYVSRGRHVRLGVDLYTAQLPLLGPNDQMAVGIVLSNLGSLFEAQGDKEEAKRLYEQALAIAHNGGDLAAEGRRLNNLGYLEISMGNSKEGKELLERALHARREARDRAGEGITLNNLAFLWNRLGRASDAGQSYEQALAIRREAGDRAGEATTLNNLGYMLSSAGRAEQAKDYYAQALQLRHEVGDRVGEAITLNNLGHVLQRLGSTEEARRLYEQALAIFDEVQAVDNAQMMREKLIRLTQEKPNS